MPTARSRPRRSARPARSRPPADPRPHPRRRHRGVLRRGLRRRAGGAHRPPRPDQQADALPLLRQQGGPLPRDPRPEAPGAVGLGRRGAGRRSARASRRGSGWRATTASSSASSSGRPSETGRARCSASRSAAPSSPAPSPTCARASEAGLLPAGLDARLLLLAILGLVTYPLVFPQVTRLVMGRSLVGPRVPPGAGRRSCVSFSDRALREARVTAPGGTAAARRPRLGAVLPCGLVALALLARLLAGCDRGAGSATATAPAARGAGHGDHGRPARRAGAGPRHRQRAGRSPPCRSSP